VGTAGLLATVVGSGIMAERLAGGNLALALLGTLRRRPEAVPWAVGPFVTAGCWFTASTSFANPAVTVGRAFTDIFSGIRPGDVPAFVIAQCAGAAVATAFFAWLHAERATARSGRGAG